MLNSEQTLEEIQKALLAPDFDKEKSNVNWYLLKWVSACLVIGIGLFFIILVYGKRLDARH